MLSFAREGYPFLIGATLMAVIAFMLALRLRSWPLWLAAFGFIVLALSVSWYFRVAASSESTVGDAATSMSVTHAPLRLVPSSLPKPVAFA